MARRINTSITRAEISPYLRPVPVFSPIVMTKIDIAAVNMTSISKIQRIIICLLHEFLESFSHKISQLL